jgi:hypothetical protein
MSIENQPAATRSPLHFAPYRIGGGQSALSITLHIKEMAKFYRPHREDLYPALNDRWASISGSEHVPHLVNGVKDALRVMETCPFPVQVQAQAKRAASKLTDVFQQVEDWTTISQQRSGRMDRRQVQHIAQTLERDGDLSTLRPYKRSEPLPARQPLIAIVTSGAWGQMWADETYIPRALTLTLAVQWACEAVGVQARSFFTLGHSRIGKRYKHARVQAGVEIADSRARTPLPTYLVALHRDLYRYGFMSACTAHQETYAELGRIKGLSPSRDYAGQIFTAATGGWAVDWARQMIQPDMVISIGANTDAHAADVALNSRFTVEAAVASIAQQLKPRR